MSMKNYKLYRCPYGCMCEICLKQPCLDIVEED